MARIDPEEYAEHVLGCVEQVPRGRVTTYGVIAEVVGAHLGGGGPRQVGSVLASYGGPVPWWRVVRADGSPPGCHDGEAHLHGGLGAERVDLDGEAHLHHLEEGTPLRPSGRVDLGRALWRPPAIEA